MAGSRGRRPNLTLRGCYVLALCLVLLIVGVGCGSWPLAAAGLGTTTLLLTSYLGFAASAALLWRRHLELVWWLPRSASSEGLVAQRPFTVQVTLRNVSPVHLGLGELRGRALERNLGPQGGHDRSRLLYDVAFDVVLRSQDQRQMASVRGPDRGKASIEALAEIVVW